MATQSLSRIQAFFSNRWFLAQCFLAVAGAFGWNILGLAILLERHKYLRTLDWWGIVLVFGVFVVAAMGGWIWAIFSYQPSKISPENTRRQKIKVALWTGGAAFGLGWVICIWLMMRLMNNEPWCIVGALGAMIGDWLPTGLVITGLTVAISLVSAPWFSQSAP